MDTTQWPQGSIGVLVKPSSVENSKPGHVASTDHHEKKPRPQKEQAVHCPRCSSTNTKFCYYNNYSLSQPRYFCKTCRRYWTEGGTLRNVPVGGSSRKNKRSSSASSSNIVNSTSALLSSSKKAITDNNNATPANNCRPQNPNHKFHIVGEHDLNLAYNPPPFDHGVSGFVSLPSSLGALDRKNLNPHQNQYIITSTSDTSSDDHHHDIPLMELLKTANMGSTRGLNNSSFLSHVPGSDSNSSIFSSIGFPPHDDRFMKPSLSFTLDGLDQDNNGYGNNIQVGVDDHTNHPSIDILFPFEELKPPVSISCDIHHGFEQADEHRVQAGDHHSNGFNWDGMLAGGGSW